MYKDDLHDSSTKQQCGSCSMGMIGVISYIDHTYNRVEIILLYLHVALNAATAMHYESSSQGGCAIR